MHRVYFVEDNPLILESFMSRPVFLECGFINVGHSVNPVEALKAIKDTNPDVVFTDLKMPGLNGIELMDKLKLGGYDGEFVVISAYSDYSEVRRFFNMDGFDYLVKPVSENELQALLVKLSDRLTAKKADVNPARGTPSPELNKITAHLRAHISDRHTLESIGSKFNLKPNFICNLFSRFLGTTFISYLTNIRMEEAALLLRISQKPVKEVAIICGYPNYFYFCRVFREAYACTPTMYRERDRDRDHDCARVDEDRPGPDQ